MTRPTSFRRTTWPRALVWWAFMLLFTVFPGAGVIAALVNAEWGQAFFGALIGSAVFLMIRSEWHHWREMIPGRFLDPSH